MDRDSLAQDLLVRTSEMNTARTLYQTFTSGGASNSGWFLNEVEEFIASYDVSGSGADSQRNALEDAAQAFANRRNSAITSDINGTIQTGCNNHSSMNANSYYPSEGPSLDADLVTKQNAVTAAQTAKVAADADAIAKYDLVEDDYQAAKAVCPDWSPDIPLPPRP